MAVTAIGQAPNNPIPLNTNAIKIDGKYEFIKGPYGHSFNPYGQWGIYKNYQFEEIKIKIGQIKFVNGDLEFVDEPGQGQRKATTTVGPNGESLWSASQIMMLKKNTTFTVVADMYGRTVTIQQGNNPILGEPGIIAGDAKNFKSGNE